jgi:hypothetical protein
MINQRGGLWSALCLLEAFRGTLQHIEARTRRLVLWLMQSSAKATFCMSPSRALPTIALLVQRISRSTL